MKTDITLTIKTLFNAYYILAQNIINCKYTFHKNKITVEFKRI